MWYGHRLLLDPLQEIRYCRIELGIPALERLVLCFVT